MQTKSKYPISQKLKDYLGIEFLENVAWLAICIFNMWKLSINAYPRLISR